MNVRTGSSRAKEFLFEGTNENEVVRTDYRP